MEYASWNHPKEVTDHGDTVDGSEILHQLRLLVYPIIYKALCIPGGCFGVLSHQLVYGEWSNSKDLSSLVAPTVSWIHLRKQTEPEPENAPERKRRNI